MFEQYKYCWGVWIEQLRILSLGIKSEDGYFIDVPPGLEKVEDEGSHCGDEEDFNGMDPLEDSESEADDSLNDSDEVGSDRESGGSVYSENWEGLEEEINPEDLVR